MALLTLLAWLPFLFAPFLLGILAHCADKVLGLLSDQQPTTPTKEVTP